MARLFKPLANPSRLEIIEVLSQGEKSVESIALATDLSVANASQHLLVLKNNNILKSRRDGHYVYYSLINDEFLVLYQSFINYAVSEIAELEKILERQRQDNRSQDAVNLEELENMLKNDDVLLLDVRPSAEYEAGHITGAMSAPLNEIIQGLKKISKKKEIIAYCRGPFCVLADEAVKILSEKGYKIQRLDKGYPEWRIRMMEKSLKNT